MTRHLAKMLKAHGCDEARREEGGGRGAYITTQIVRLLYKVPLHLVYASFRRSWPQAHARLGGPRVSKASRNGFTIAMNPDEWWRSRIHKRRSGHPCRWAQPAVMTGFEERHIRNSEQQRTGCLSTISDDEEEESEEGEHSRGRLGHIHCFRL